VVTSFRDRLPLNIDQFIITMDPLSVTVGIVGMLQGIERLRKLASGVRSYVNASSDIDALLCEVRTSTKLWKFCAHLLYLAIGSLPLGLTSCFVP
jgi:hypothetical protein